MLRLPHSKNRGTGKEGEAEDGVEIEHQREVKEERKGLDRFMEVETMHGC
jgi:hypothetical protein